MRKKPPVHNLDTLEKEILRHKLRIMEIEDKLGKNVDHLQENFSAYVSGSLSCKSGDKHADKTSFFDSFISDIADKAANRASETVDRLLDKLFRKHS